MTKNNGNDKGLLDKLAGIEERFQKATQTYTDSSRFPADQTQADIERTAAVLRHAQTNPTKANITRAGTIVDFLERFSQVCYGLRFYKGLSEEKNKENKELKGLLGTDKLTGLPNRAAFDVQIEKAVNENGKPPHHLHVETFPPSQQHRKTDTPEIGKKHFFALIMIDLDRLKSLNDDYGHPTGDAGLQAFGNLLNKIARSDDGTFGGRSRLSRLGGDEFTLIMDTHAENYEQASETFQKGLERIRKDTFAQYFSHNGKSFPLVASMGMYAIKDGDTVQIVKEQADIELYKDKDPRTKKARYEASVKAIEEQGISLESLTEKRSERVLSVSEIERITSILKDAGVIEIVSDDQLLREQIQQLSKNPDLLKSGIVVKQPKQNDPDLPQRLEFSQS